MKDRDILSLRPLEEMRQKVSRGDLHQLLPQLNRVRIILEAEIPRPVKETFLSLMTTIYGAEIIKVEGNKVSARLDENWWVVITDSMEIDTKNNLRPNERPYIITSTHGNKNYRYQLSISDMRYLLTKAMNTAEPQKTPLEIRTMYDDIVLDGIKDVTPHNC